MANNTGAGLDTGLDETARFLNSCATAVRARQAQVGTEEEPSAFLLGTLPKGTVTLPGYEYLETGQHAIGGKLFVSNEALGNVRTMDLNAGVTELNQRIDALGLGSLPAVVYVPGLIGQNLYLYPEGVSAPNSKSSYRIDSTPDVAPFDVEQFIGEVHAELFVTPAVQSSGMPLWEDPARHYPKSNAELRIQAQLRGAFSRTFPGVRAIPEETTVAGRVDLKLMAMMAGGVRKNLGLLELKVLRSFGQGGSRYSHAKTVAWIDSGIDQAFNYAAALGCAWKTVCCFDMRTSPSASILEISRDLANRHDVRLAHWPIYASVGAYRAAQS